MEIYIMGDNNNNVYINSDGEKVPRVSEIINNLAKSQLIVWANYLGFKRIDYKKELDRTAGIGSYVHEFIDNYTNNLFKLDLHEDLKRKVGGDDNAQEVYNCIRSFRKWHEENKDWYKVVNSELRLVGKNFGGTLDCVIESPFNSKHVVICDYKTSKQFAVTQFLQLVAYSILYEDILNIEVDGIMVIRMDKKGGSKAKYRLLTKDQLHPFIEVFKALLVVNANIKECENLIK